MAQCTMHLIIVIPLLLIVTVVTAFRLRDISPKALPNSETTIGQTIKSGNTNPPYEHCEKCESSSSVNRESECVSNVFDNKIKRKHMPNKMTYSEMKLAVKEKQNLINLKRDQTSEVNESVAKITQNISQFRNCDDDSDVKSDDLKLQPGESDSDISSNEHKAHEKQQWGINKGEHDLEHTDSSVNVNYHNRKVRTSSSKHEYVKRSTHENGEEEILKRSLQHGNIKSSKQSGSSDMKSDLYKARLRDSISEDNVRYSKLKIVESQNPIKKETSASITKKIDKVDHAKEYHSHENNIDTKVEKKSVHNFKDTHVVPANIKVGNPPTITKTTHETAIEKKTEKNPTTSKIHEANTAASTKEGPKNSVTKKNIYKEDKVEHDQYDPFVWLTGGETKKGRTESPKKKTKNYTKNDVKINSETIRKNEMPDSDRNKKVADALYRKNLLQNEFDDFYFFFPTFAPNFSRIHNPECRRHGQILLRQLRGTKLWALQMLDSSAKIPSGLLRGNGNQLGDFDQCLASQARVRLDSGAVVRVRGRYCLAHVDVEAAHMKLNLPVHLALGRNMIRSSNTDPGHFIPRFTSLSWAICMPAACGAAEAEFALRDALRHYNGTAGLRTRVHVNDRDCRELSEGAWWSRWINDVPTLLSVFFFLTSVLVVTYATVTDFIQRSNYDENSGMPPENKDMPHQQDSESRETADSAVKDEEDAAATQLRGSRDVVKKRSFSLYETSRKIFKQGTEEGEIACIHGVRAVCSVALLMAHKLIPLAMTPFTNRIYLTELSNSPFSILLRASLIYTDSFLLLSGVLTAYHMSRDLNATGSIPWIRRCIARYIRLTPALFAVVIWYAWVSDKVGDGPQWGSVVVANADLCRQNFWKNVLYIHNFFPFEEMCAPHTHQLALDMQLTILAPALVWLLHARPLAGFATLAALHGVSGYLRYWATMDHNLSLVIYHGITLGQLYRTANHSYSIALHRATPYAAGVSLGVLLRHMGNDKTHISKMILYPGWLLCAYMCGWTLCAASHTSARDYRYDVSDAALFAALASLAWALCLSWLIFACATGNGGLLNTLLCAQPLVIISRLSYAMYLCQFLVFFYNVGSIRSSMEFNLFSFIDIAEITTILVVSIIISAVFIIPMQSLQKHIMFYDFGCKAAQEESKVNVTSQEAHEEESAQVQVVIGPEDTLDDSELHIDYTEHDVLQEIMEEEEEEEDNEESLNDASNEVNLGSNNLWAQRRAELLYDH